MLYVLAPMSTIGKRSEEAPHHYDTFEERLKSMQSFGGPRDSKPVNLYKLAKMGNKKLFGKLLPHNRYKNITADHIYCYPYLEENCCIAHRIPPHCSTGPA